MSSSEDDGCGLEYAFGSDSLGGDAFGSDVEEGSDAPDDMAAGSANLLDDFS